MKFSIPIPWWFYAMFAVMTVFPLIERLVKELIRERRFARAGLSDIQDMHWRDFERYLAHLFRSLGYDADVTPASGDYGVDVILTDGSGRRIAVQAKHWKGRKVGAPEIQKTIGGAAYYKCEQSIVVTTSGYTDQAREMARQTGVELWGLEELGDAMARARAGRGAAQAQVVAAAQTPVARPTAKPPAPGPTGAPGCPKCGAPMVQRMAQGQAIWLCSKFPGCNGSRTKE